MLGQSGSTNASGIQKKLKYSGRIEPYLTFLNVHAAHRLITVFPI